jgi:hypothetical protein
LDHYRLGVGNAICIGEGYDQSAKRWVGRDEADVDRRPSTSNAAKRLVDHDSSKPGAEPRFAPEAVEIREGAGIGFLEDVFGVGIVPHDAARDTVEPLVLLLDDEPDTIAILLARAFQKPVIVRGLLKNRRRHFNPQAFSNPLI